MRANESEQGLAGKANVNTRANIIKHLVENGLTTKQAESQVTKGVQIEMEHTKSKKTALGIAMDHLVEFSTYYTGLKVMETQLEALKPKPTQETKDFVKMLIKTHDQLCDITPIEGQPYHALFCKYMAMTCRMLGWVEGKRIKNKDVMRTGFDGMIKKMKEIKIDVNQPDKIDKLIDTMKETSKLAKNLDENWYKTIDTCQQQPKKTKNKSHVNKAELAVGGDLYYFQPLPDGLLFNMEDVRQTLARHGLTITKTRFKPSAGTKIHEITLEIDPADKHTVQKVEAEIDAYLKNSPITQGGKRSIIVQTTEKAELLFIIEDGVSRVFEGEPDDIDEY